MRLNLAAVAGFVLALIVAGCCLLALAGCHASPSDADAMTGHFTKVDGSFNKIDGTATALESGAVHPKAAAKTIHAEVKNGKGASSAASEAVVDLMERAEKAEEALASRGRLWMERGLFGAGAVCWALAGWQVWTLLGVLGLVAAAPGAGLVAAGVSSVSGRQPSVIRRACFIACAFALGCAFFWALANLDDILFIGKCTAGVLALLAGIAGFLHFRKKAKVATKVIKAVDAARKSPAGGPDVVAFKDPATKVILDTMGADGKAFVNEVQRG